MNTYQEFILASTSTIRKKILDQAGLKYQAIAPIKEEPRANKNSELIPYLHECSRGKAIEISKSNPNIPVFGCDQVVHFEGTILNKIHTPEDAVNRLISFSNKSHELVNGLCCCINGEEVYFETSKTIIHVRKLNKETIVDYIKTEKPLSSVACYFLEGKGIQLINKIDGDFFSALGLPLFKIMDCLNKVQIQETM